MSLKVIFKSFVENAKAILTKNTTYSAEAQPQKTPEGPISGDF